MKIPNFAPPAAVVAIVYLLGGKPGRAPDDSNPKQAGASSSETEVRDTLTPKPKKKAGPVEHIDSHERLAAVKLVEASDPILREIKIFNAEIRGAFDERKFDFLPVRVVNS